MDGAELMPAHALYPILFISLEVIFCLKMQHSQNPTIFKESGSAGIFDSEKLNRTVWIPNFHYIAIATLSR